MTMMVLRRLTESCCRSQTADLVHGKTQKEINKTYELGVGTMGVNHKKFYENRDVKLTNHVCKNNDRDGISCLP